MSVTTRFPRPAEIDGVHYHFVSRARFDGARGRGRVARVGRVRREPLRHPAQRRCSTTSPPAVPVLLEIDLQGARQVRAAMPEAQLVFLAPPSWDELVRRLAGRGTESPEVVERRLAVAREELAAEKEFDVTLVNTSVQDVVDSLLALTPYAS